MASNYFHKGPATASANTVIVVTVPPRRHRWTRIMSLRYTSTTTAHTLTCLMALGSTTLAAAASAGQALVTLTADPGPVGNGIAAADYLVFEKPDGTVHTDTVSAWNSETKVVTLTNNVPTGGFAIGAKCWFHGVAGDQTSDQVATIANTVLSLSQDFGALHSPGGVYEPIVIHSNNGSNAGTLNHANGIYSNQP